MTIEGEWHNEHGSKMILRREGRLLRGAYHTPIGVAAGIYEVVGAMDEDSGPCLSIGFVVVWQNAGGNSHSVTCWSGQVHLLDGQDAISTTWLLTTEGANEWRATQVGRDEFRRSAPTEAERLARHRIQASSHPVALRSS